MGGDYSKEEYDRFAVDIYGTAQRHPCILPDVSLDESLLKYSGINSTTELQTFTNLQIDMVPNFIDRLGSSLAGLDAVPNAVGLGALVISMILEIVIKGGSQREDSYDMFRRVFGEEKASAVRDTVSEYVKRHRRFLKNSRRLEGELRRLEAQLSNHLTILLNSLLHDNQMSTRGFKIWVNGAAFHVQMMIHEARLGVRHGRPQSDYDEDISAAINVYLIDLDRLIEKYKTFLSSNLKVDSDVGCSPFGICIKTCFFENKERKCNVRNPGIPNGVPCDGQPLNDAFLDLVFTKQGPLSSHFSDIKTNLTILINQHDSFIPPSPARRCCGAA